LLEKPPSVTCAFGCAFFSAADVVDVAVFAANCWLVASIVIRVVLVVVGRKGGLWFGDALLSVLMR
jgi:hypothetical protein